MKTLHVVKIKINEVPGTNQGDIMAHLLEQLASQVRGKNKVPVGEMTRNIGGDTIRVTVFEDGKAVPKKAKNSHRR